MSRRAECAQVTDVAVGYLPEGAILCNALEVVPDGQLAIVLRTAVYSSIALVGTPDEIKGLIAKMQDAWVGGASVTISRQKIGVEQNYFMGEM